MAGYVDNIEDLALKNTYFRRVLCTTQHTQLVVMSLGPNEEIGEETHEYTDQFFRVEKGEGKVIIDEEEHTLDNGSAILIPAGAKHNVINTSNSVPLKLYTLYSPPHHKDAVVHKTKAEAENDDSDHL